MRIQHNVMAMNAYRNYSNNTSALSKNLERLSSGYKINRAGDDAAGLAISEKMRAQITGLEAAQKNVKDGISLVNTAEGAMQEIQDMLNRMVYLATQSANGTYDNEVDRLNLQKEVDSLKTEIDRIADSANFNGIKLLDGSQSSTGSASVSVKGVDYSVVNAVAGKVQSDALNPTAMKADGDSFTFTVGMDDGSSITVGVTAKFDPDGTTGKEGILVGDDGTIYGKVADLTTTGFTATDVNNAILKQLKANDKLSNNFKISLTGGKATFENIEPGKTGIPQITALGWVEKNDGAITAQGGTLEDVTVGAADKGIAIKASDIKLYDGKNYEDAVFEINGKKFVVVTYNQDFTGNDIHKASQGLGSDVTVLIAANGTNKGLTENDDNFNQNIAKIKEVTGLDVRKSAAAANGNGDIGVGTGIVISASGTKGGLTLQIGDTSDDFNQLKVGIGDMHVKAMGISGINIGTQSGAQAAVDVIKQAINYVSGVRGDLGAISNRLDHTANNLSVMRENITDAESAIRDTDIAEEMMSYTKNNILVQSAQAMLAQANQVPQGVLQLLQ